MKATGIVRRIDDLGRVVIPKEIRRTMRIREGDPLEIFTTRDGEVIFKKYSLIGGLEDFAAQFCDTLAHSSDFTAAITDRDSVIATAGPGKRELIGHNLSREMEQLMEGRSVYQRTKADDALPVCEGSPHLIAATAAPILCQGDVLGLVLFAAGEGELPGESEYKLAQIVAAFLGRHMEA
jgi:AbrB family transcriptional regulator (stage V sporulation protein T)